MIQLSSLLWVSAIFFAVIGFLRGWNREIVALSGIVLGMFALFQFDSVIRSLIFVSLPRDQVFLVQAGLFMVIVYIAYQTRGPGIRRSTQELQTHILGGIIGFANGYLICGTLWYFLDINEYPLAPLIIGPGVDSPSAQALSSMPIVLLGGGVSGSGDFLAVIVLLLFLVVLLVI